MESKLILKNQEDLDNFIIFLNRCHKQFGDCSRPVIILSYIENLDSIEKIYIDLMGYLDVKVNLESKQELIGKLLLIDGIDIPINIKFIEFLNSLAILDFSNWFIKPNSPMRNFLNYFISAVESIPNKYIKKISNQSK